MPLKERHVQCAGNFLGKQCLAGARFALDQQGALQDDGGVDRQRQVAGGDVGFSAFKLHVGLSERAAGAADFFDISDGIHLRFRLLGGKDDLAQALQ